MFGEIFTYFLFGFSIIAAAIYFYSHFKSEKPVLIGRTFYLMLSGGMVLLSAYFLANILTHNFQFTYIWQYSSTNLPLNLLISTFYAGQEGSFMLWALMTSLIGVFLIPYAKKHGYEPLVMGFYSLIMIFLTLMLILKSPFHYIWETFSGQNLEVGFKPEEGRGLNPILENYWMSIHPPILFAGYSAMSVPYVFALASLIKKDFNKWINISFPWTVFATGMLGLGIALGGFWSYETLGWGGYWAWDPVENSSLLPWLIGVALIHTMLVQKRTGGLKITNFLFSIFGFVLVLYATFLTRSGVLGDTSVHSFVDPGMIVYTLLLIGLFLFLFIGIGGILLRLKDISSNRIEFNATSREFSLSLGSIFLLAMTVIVFVGTSWPIFAELLGQKKASVPISFYNQWNLPIAILILVGNGIAIFLRWKATNNIEVLRKVLYAAIFSMAVSIFMMFLVINKVSIFLLLFAALFSLFLNGEYVVKTLFKKPASAGAFISHAGLAVMMIGVLASGVYSKTENIHLKKNETEQALGYKLTYIGKKQIEKEKPDRAKFQYLVEISKKGKKSITKPIMYWSDFNNRESPFLEPGIKEGLMSDLYISPRTVEKTIDMPTAALRRQQSATVPLDSSIRMEMVKFDMTKIMKKKISNSDFATLGTVINFHKGEETFEDTLFTELNMRNGQCDPHWYKLKNSDIEIGFVRLIRNPGNLTQSKAAFVFRKANEAMPDPVEVLSIEVSVKPLIILVWAGIVLIVLGFFLSVFKRLRILRQENA